MKLSPEQMPNWSLPQGTSCRNTWKSYVLHPALSHDRGMCAREIQSHICKFDIKKTKKHRLSGNTGLKIGNFKTAKRGLLIKTIA